MSVLPIPFEVLRRADGRVALSVNAGTLAFSPQRLQAHARGLVVCGARRADRALICCRDGDVWARLQAQRALRLYEFSSMGLMASHLLRLDALGSAMPAGAIRGAAR